MARADYTQIFARLRAILEKHAGKFSVQDDSDISYCLEGDAGPATLAAWKGKLKHKTIPVAWVQAGKAYVSYHLMGLGGDDNKLRDAMSKELKARMQGKTCFNFKTDDDALFKELDKLTSQSLAALKKAGFVAD